MPVAWRTKVLSSCKRRPNGKNIWPAFTVNLPRIGVSSRYASRFSESSGAIFWSAYKDKRFGKRRTSA